MARRFGYSLSVEAFAAGALRERRAAASYPATMSAFPASGGTAGIEAAIERAVDRAVKAAVAAKPAAPIDARQFNEFKGGERPTRAQLEYANRQHAWAVAGAVNL